MTDETQPKKVYKFIKDYDFEGKAKDLLLVMQDVIRNHGEDVDVSTTEGGGIEVYHYRLETEDEVKARLAVYDRTKEYRRQQFLRLKEEFEPVDAGVLGYNQVPRSLDNPMI